MIVLINFFIIFARGKINLEQARQGGKKLIQDVLTRDTVRVRVEAGSWEEAVRAAGDLLYRKGAVEKRYIDNMIRIVKEIGLSLITLKTPIPFGCEENDPVSLVFALSAVDNSSHLELISEMARIFDNEEGMKQLIECNTEDELLKIIRTVTEE